MLNVKLRFPNPTIGEHARQFALSVLLVLFSVPGAVVATPQVLLPVGVSNGLDIRESLGLLVDKDGLLWVASREGMYRYDGYRAKAISTETAVAGPLASTGYRLVTQSRDGGYWLGGIDSGLTHYNAESRAFRKWRYDSEDVNSISSDTLFGIAEDPQGLLWIATRQGLNQLDRKTGRFRRFFHDPTDPNSLPHDFVTGVSIGLRGEPWVSTRGGGVAQWLPDEGRFRRFDLARLCNLDSSTNNARTLRVLADGSVWIGARLGLLRLMADSGRCDLMWPVKPSDKSSIITLEPGAGKSLIFAGNQAGVFSIDTVAGHVQRLDLTTEPEVEMDDAVLSLARNGDWLFVGSLKRGVRRLQLAATPFDWLGQSALSSKLGTASDIMTISGTQQLGQLLAGNPGNGVYQIDTQRRVIVPARSAAEDRSAMITQLARTNDGLWFAGTNFGLRQIDSEGRTLRQFPLGESGMPTSGIVSRLHGTHDNLWMGMDSGGLVRLRPSDGKIQLFKHDPKQKTSLRGDRITALLEEQDVLWVGTASEGLNRCQLADWHCQHFNSRQIESHSLPFDHVNDIYRDKNRRLWVAGNGGLAQLAIDANGLTQMSTVFNRQRGLLEDDVFAIGEDLDGSLWLSSARGLTRLEPETGRFAHYTSRSGLRHADFYRGAVLAEPNWLYFGSAHGLLMVRKGSRMPDRQPAALAITGIERITDDGALSELSGATRTVRMKWGEVLAIELAVLDYSETLHDYKYRLAPNLPWLPMRNRRQVTLHGLGPGSYRFEAQGRDVNGLWTSPRLLLIEILPPFWMTTWFKLLVVLSCLAMLFGWHRLHLARQRRRTIEAQRLAQIREHVLEEALGPKAELALLTSRQKEILQLIAEGQATREIAERLGISIKTVEAHRANLMERLDIHDVAGLVRLAIRARLVKPH